MYELDEFDPFRELRRANRRLYRLFNFGFPAWRGESGIREPLIDIVDKDDALEITAELPGVDKKDIKINVLEDSVALKAESKTEIEKKQEKKGYYFHERSYSSFSRVIPLPTEVIAEKTKANFKNGILTLILPKKYPTEKKPRGFEVKID